MNSNLYKHGYGEVHARDYIQKVYNFTCSDFKTFPCSNLPEIQNSMPYVDYVLHVSEISSFIRHAGRKVDRGDNIGRLERQTKGMGRQNICQFRTFP